MASSNNVIQARNRRKHRNSTVTLALGHHKKQYSEGVDGNFSSPVKSWEVSKKKRGFCKEACCWVVADAVHATLKGSYSSPSSSSMSQITFPHYYKPGENIKENKNQLRRPITILRSRNRLRCELESSVSLLKVSKEVAKKWNPTLSEASNEFIRINSRKLLKDKRLVCDHNSVVSTLLEELLQAQRSIKKHQAEQKFIKKNVEFFLLQNLAEEIFLLKRKEQYKIKATLDDLNSKLESERRCRQKTELLNTKLVHELAEANLLAKQFMTNYNKEKKERELMEEMCEELAMQIGKDKAKLTVILSESERIFEEVEEERNMMQMAELWREERVQMKLVDAQLILEDKYNQLMQLTASLKMFLISRGAELDTTELEDAESIKQEVESINIQRVMELSFDV